MSNGDPASLASNPNLCEECGEPATQWAFGKSDAMRPLCGKHGLRLRDPADVAEIERLARELEVQKAVNDLAYIPHRNLVESRDGLQKRFDKVEAERDRLRARCDELERANVGLATESERLRAGLENIATGRSWDERNTSAAGYARWILNDEPSAHETSERCHFRAFGQLPCGKPKGHDGDHTCQLPADHRSGTEPLSRVIADLEMAISPDLTRSVADRFELVEKVLRQLKSAENG